MGRRRGRRRGNSYLPPRVLTMTAAALAEPCIHHGFNRFVGCQNCYWSAFIVPDARWTVAQWHE